MLEITTHLPAPACYLLFSRTGIPQFQRLDPDLFPFAHAREEGLWKGLRAAGRSAPRRRAGRFPVKSRKIPCSEGICPSGFGPQVEAGVRPLRTGGVATALPAVATRLLRFARNDS